MKNTSTVFRGVAVLAVAAAPLAFGAVATAAGPVSVDLRPAGPTGDCDWVDQAAVADLSVDEAVDELSELTTLTAAVSATGLGPQLADDGPLTIFAPSNDAFSGIPENVWDSILADPDLLESILGYHVVVGDAFSADELLSEGTVETLTGTLEITADGDTLIVNGGEATVTCAGIQTANATIFVVDQVLQPATSDLATDGSSIPGSSIPGSSVPGSSVPG